MLGDHLLQHSVLGVSRAMHGRHTRHAPRQRGQLSVPMAKD